MLQIWQNTILCFFGGPPKSGVKSRQHYSYGHLARTLQNMHKITNNAECENVLYLTSHAQNMHRNVKCPLLLCESNQT